MVDNSSTCFVGVLGAVFQVSGVVHSDLVARPGVVLAVTGSNNFLGNTHDE